MTATERIYLRATPHTKAMIKQASEQMGVSMSQFILGSAYQKALEIRQHQEKKP